MILWNLQLQTEGVNQRGLNLSFVNDPAPHFFQGDVERSLVPRLYFTMCPEPCVFCSCL